MSLENFLVLRGCKAFQSSLFQKLFQKLEALQNVPASVNQWVKTQLARGVESKEAMTVPGWRQHPGHLVTRDPRWFGGGEGVGDTMEGAKERAEEEPDV